MARKLSVAIQGERGSFSEEAALRLLGEKAEVHCCKHFNEVVERTLKGASRYCLLPIENSLTGSIYKNYDLLLRHKLRILREVYLRIEHHLIVLPGVRFGQIETVLSHPVALEQCEKFFEAHPRLRRRSAYDTSGSVKRLFEENLRNCGAIASRRAAEFYGGEILASGIEDNKANFTRFVLLAPRGRTVPGSNKTSIVFSFRNAPGALFKSLSVFALRNIDLTKIESRPIQGRPWEYLFYLDFLGNLREKRVKNALAHLREIADFLEVLGCYPRDQSVEKKGM